MTTEIIATPYNNSVIAVVPLTPLELISIIIGLVIIITGVILIIKHKTIIIDVIKTHILPEITQLDVNLTIVGFCFWFLLSMMTFILYVFFVLMDATLIEQYGESVSVLADPFISNVLQTGLDTCYYLLLILGIWCASNVVHMCYEVCKQAYNWRYQ